MDDEIDLQPGHHCSHFEDVSIDRSIAKMEMMNIVSARQLML
jgi:hypothetical protein